MAITVRFNSELLTEKDGTNSNGSVVRGELLTIVKQEDDWAWVDVESPGAEVRRGWIQSKAILENYEPKFSPDIDQAAFASDCLSAARFYGSNVHFLLAWAHLASEIKNTKVESDDSEESKKWPFFGPFRFSKFTWGRYRVAEEFPAKYGDVQLHDPFCQCDVAAVISARALKEMEKKLGEGNVDAKSLGFAVLLGWQAALKALETPEAKLADLIASSHTEERMLKEVTLRTKLLEKIAGISLLDKSVTQVLEVIVKALDASLAKTKPLILALDPDEFPLVADTAIGLSGADVLMAAAPAGAEPVHGHLVKRLQEALNAPVSTIFDKATIDALNALRKTKNKPESNSITAEEWVEITKLPKPEMYDVCTQITASFEGHGFGDKVAGSFDGAILTWGYNGFTFLYEHVQRILERIEKADPGILTEAFGAADAQALREMLKKDLEAQLAWGKANFLKSDGESLKENWRDGFKKLGHNRQVEDIQLDYSKSVLWPIATNMASKLGLNEEDPLSLALCFDIVIQNGRTAKSFEGLKFPANATDLEKREMLAEAMLATMKKNNKYKEDTRLRKSTLAKGAGKVHGDNYDLSIWGLFPATFESLDEQDDQTADEPAANDSFEAYFKSELGNITAFKAREFLVKGSNKSKLNRDPPQHKWRNIVPLVRLLQTFADTYAEGNKVMLNSVYRDPAYNATLKGAAKKSQHMEFKAADVRVPGKGGPREWARVFRKLRSEGAFKGGIGLYPTFVHVDVRGSNANWERG
jgi:uncharacterized protein YcbK (DUF882 family)